MAALSEDQRQHLAFIQDVITRMNSNSFSLKGLMITIVAVLGAFFVGNYDKSTAIIYLGIALLLVVLFWFLDSYYLKMEQQYRKLYDDVVAGKVDAYKMNADDYEVCYCSILFSKTIWPLYIPVLAILIVAIILIH